MTDRTALSEAVALGAMSDVRPLDVWDDQALEQLISALSVPRSIDQVEAIEAWVKESWWQGLDSCDERVRRRFAEFFLRLGSLPKYKSYGVKYAAPFGYALFDLQNNGGFSIQLHETSKVEAFHVLGVHPQAFILLCSMREWAEHGAKMIDLWESGQPVASPLAYRPQVGDVAVVEDLNTIHTVIGCLVEEFATSSYDVVLRMHDQNLGRPLILPDAHRSLATVLEGATAVSPRRRLRRADEWVATAMAEGTSQIAHLPEKGLVANHVALSAADPAVKCVASEVVTTLVVLAGGVTLDVDGLRLDLRAGDLTALAPGSNYSISTDDQARVSCCEVALTLAFADLR